MKPGQLLVLPEKLSLATCEKIYPKWELNLVRKNIILWDFECVSSCVLLCLWPLKLCHDNKSYYKEEMTPFQKILSSYADLGQPDFTEKENEIEILLSSGKGVNGFVFLFGDSKTIWASEHFINLVQKTKEKKQNEACNH